MLEKLQDLTNKVRLIPESKFTYDLIAMGVLQDPYTELQDPASTARGCAIGFLPIFYPAVWKFVTLQDVRLIGHAASDCLHEQLAAYFGIKVHESMHLFLPLSEWSTKWGPQEVADKFQRFLDRKYAEAA